MRTLFNIMPLALCKSGLHSGEKIILSDIFTCLYEKHRFYKSNRRISKETGITPSSVSRYINLLKHKKWITTKHIQSPRTRQNYREITGIDLNKILGLHLDHNFDSYHTVYSLANSDGVSKKSGHPKKKFESGYPKNSDTPYTQNQHQVRSSFLSRSKSKIQKYHHLKTDDEKTKNENYSALKIKSNNINVNEPKQMIQLKTFLTNLEKSSGFYKKSRVDHNIHSKYKQTCEILHKYFNVMLTNYTFKCVHSWMRFPVEDISPAMNICKRQDITGKQAVRTIGIILISSYQVYEKRISSVYQRLMNLYPVDITMSESLNNYLLTHESLVSHCIAKVLAKHYDFRDLKPQLDSSTANNMDQLQSLIVSITSKCDTYSIVALAKKSIDKIIQNA